jgi:hypothetical protein
LGYFIPTGFAIVTKNQKNIAVLCTFDLAFNMQLYKYFAAPLLFICTMMLLPPELEVNGIYDNK